MTTDLGPAATPRPVPSPEDRMADTRTGTDHLDVAAELIDAGLPHDVATWLAARDARTAPTFRTYLDATERGQLDARAATAEQDRDDALQDRDEARQTAKDLYGTLKTIERERNEAIEARDVARQTAAFRQGVIERHRQELGAAGDVLAVVRDAAERIDRALATYDTTPGEPEHFARLDGTCWADCPGCSTPTLGSPTRRAQEPTAGEARRLLDQAIDTALPLAGRSVRKLLKALRRELARVDSGRAPAGDPA